MYWKGSHQSKHLEMMKASRCMGLSNMPPVNKDAVSLSNSLENSCSNSTEEHVFEPLDPNHTLTISYLLEDEAEASCADSRAALLEGSGKRVAISGTR